MKVSCPNCAQRIAIDAEALASLRGCAEFECPSCAAAVPFDASADSLDGLNVEHLLMRGLETPQPDGGQWTPPEPEELDALLAGRYRIVSFLGRGGMGAVYRGTDARLDREVAIKILPLENADNPEALARFEWEAKAMAALDHPHAVKVHDFGTTSEGHAYIVMEFVQGADMQALRKSGQLTLATALELISQVCSALHHAHSQGIIHRDIKPANVLVTTDGRAKVGDFGLARATGTGSRPKIAASLTATGHILGTPDYMAPEQRNGQRVDHRADLYALGVMLYELLTGTLPHGAWNPPSQKVEIDARLDEIVLRALQENPAERYQAAIELKLDVDCVKTTSGGAPLPPGVEPEPLPSSHAGGPIARRRGTVAAPNQTIALPPYDRESTELILKTTSSLNTTTLILGLVALLTLGALAFFLANRKTGDISNVDTTISTHETNNSYVTLPASSPQAKDLAAFAETRTLGPSIVGLSLESCTWTDAQSLAARTGGSILTLAEGDTATGQFLLEWLLTKHAADLAEAVWVRQGSEPRLFDGRKISAAAPGERPHKAIIQWLPAPPTPPPH